VLRLVYTDEAQRELVSIAHHSRTQWGTKHARTFFEGLKASIESLAEMPQSGAPADSVRPGIRKRVYQSLSIFYEIIDQDIVVLAVLHGRQDTDASLATR
jgi:toxin ParE1/3/4